MCPTALFRCDASSIIGAGHVMRSLTLAEILTGRGWRCRFMVAPETLEAAPALVASGIETVPVGPIGEDCDLTVIDHYGLGAAYEESCRIHSRHVMVIDDLADRPHRCDILLDQTIGRLASDYADLLPAGSVVLAGAEFALLRPQFAELRAKSLRRRRAGGIRRLLLAFGGADPHDLASRVLAGILGSSLKQIHVDIVCGAFGPSDALRRLAAEGRVAVHCHVADMAALMAEADLAIGAGGTTSLERCCLGLPTLLVLMADNQRKMAANLVEAGAARSLGWHHAVDAAMIAAALDRLHSETELIVAMSAAAARLCDGEGAARVAGRIEALRPKGG
jgi:UDP-2,4-diacetamido-2,4,6-trideoxy-beta-L-altropyranose hydrolase